MGVTDLTQACLVAVCGEENPPVADRWGLSSEEEEKYSRYKGRWDMQSHGVRDLGTV